MARIGILIHENEYKFLKCSYLINDLMRIWVSSGHQLVIIKGITSSPNIDILFNHVDLTKVPDSYMEFIDRFPKVINGDISDISKKAVSTNLLEKDDEYQGQVIVKPNLNAGGFAEVTKRIPDGLVLLSDEIEQQKKKVTYKVFESIGQVPDFFFESPDFVIEKFLPEKEGEIYFLRVCSFLGDKAVCSRVGAEKEIIKGRNVISREIVEPPRELLNIIKQNKFNYGKFDFCIHEGKVVVFDMNKTPGHSPYNKDNAKAIADGIKSFL